MTQSEPAVFVLDAGALIALERGDRTMIALLASVRAGQSRFVVPDAVVAQVWRGTARQARAAILLGLGPRRCLTVPLDTAAAKQIGAAIADSGHADIVDTHVALLADRHGAAVVTSDRHDICAVRRSLDVSIVDV